MGIYTALDLFSGCGGLSQGLVGAGFKVLGAVEIDPLAASTYAMNHPGVRLWKRDIREVPTAEVLSELGLVPGQLDLLAGCPPCQGFSALRTMNGSRNVHDPRNDLVMEYLRFCVEMKPKAIMLENVPALARDGRLAAVKASLQAAGYRLVDGVLDAQHYGVPQRRRRFVMLGALAREIHFGPKAVKVHTVRDAIGRLASPTVSRDALHKDRAQRSTRVMEIIRNVPKDGGGRTDLPTKLRLSCHKKTTGFKDVYGRMAWDRVAPTITGGCINPSKGRFLHPEEDRAITLREAALLQTFPARYKFPITAGSYPIAMLIGNALPPRFVKHHAIAIRKVLDRDGVPPGAA